jgi:hypothetical protein
MTCGNLAAPVARLCLIILHDVDSRLTPRYQRHSRSGWIPPWSVAPGLRSSGQVLHYRHAEPRLPGAFDPPLNLAT